MAYWNPNRTLSHGAYLNFITGNRGGGKTYGSKTWCSKHFLKTEGRFLWVRRFKDEFRGNSGFFKKIARELPGKKLAVRGDSYFIDGKNAGQKLVLSTSRMRKGDDSFSEVDTIVFDEFLIDKGVYHYLPGEVEIFLDLIDTVFRGREDVRVLCLANCISICNPYFDYFHVLPPEDVGIICKNDILTELVADPDFIDEKMNSRFGRLIAGTPYGEYNINATFRQDNDEFIESRQGRCDYQVGLHYKDMDIGIWNNYETGKVYACGKIVPGRPFYALTLDDMHPNTVLLNNVQRSFVLKAFMKAMRQGRVFCENQKTKKAVFEIGNLLRSVY